MPFELPFGVAVLNPVPVDYYSGPYTASNIQQAINIASASIPIGVRFQSMEVRLIIAGISKKYWYRDNITDLVEFSSIGSGNSDVFYNLGGTVSATNSTSAIYRTGYIGIGTASPSTKLHVYATQSGAFRLQDGTQGNNYILKSDSNGVASWTPLSSVGISGSASYIPVFTGTSSLGNSILYIEPVFGRTLIINPGRGLLSPISYLSVQRSQSQVDITLGNGDVVDIEQISSIISDNSNGFRVDSKGPLLLSTGTSYSEKVRISTNGNVGIGTASPSTKLHIFATQSGAFRLVDGTQGPGYLLASDTNGVATWTASTYAPDSNVVHKTGNENISGIKTFENIGVLTSVVARNYNTNASSSALLVEIGNPGMGIKSENASSGIGIYSNSTSTGLNYVGANSGVTTFSVNKIGGVYASSSVSIGTSGASASLHIKGTSSVSGNSLLVENSSNTQLLKVLNNGQIILGDNNAATGPGPYTGVFIIGQGTANYGSNTSNPNLLTFIVGSTDGTYVSGIQGAAQNFGNVRSGIYFTNNASDIVFRTAVGSTLLERMRINVSGNVGIGTASPSTTLHIFATQSGAFRLEDGTQGNNYILTSDSNGVATWTPLSSIGISGSASYIPKFTGTSSLGNSRFYEIGTTPNIVGYYGSGSSYVSFLPAGNTWLTLNRTQSSMNFILGNPQPNTFQVGQIQSTNTIGLSVESAGYTSFNTGPTYLEKMRITSDGNVGIGLTAPSTKLHIFATQSGAFRLEDGTQSYPGYVLTSDANGVGTWQGNTQITLSGATATALATWNNATIMCNFSATCLITIPDTGLPPNFSFRFIVISSNSGSGISFTYSSPVSILPNTLLTFAQYESGVIDRLGTGQNYYITY